MTRELNIPIFLWICAAVCAHLLFGGGGYEVGVMHDDKVAIGALGEHARERIRFSERTFELSALEAPGKATEAELTPPPPPPALKPPEKTTDKLTPPKPEAKKAPPPPRPKTETKVTVKVVPEDPAAKLLERPPAPEKRIAVRQHVQPKQEDNPTARFVGDEANKVQEETVATQTSHDQDDANPTPGGNHAGTDKRPGDSDRTKIAESDDHAGEKNRAPGERGTEFEVQKEPMATRAQGPVAIAGAASTQAPRAGGDGRPTGASDNTPPSPMAPGGPGPASPDIEQSANGSWSFNPIRPGAGNGTSTEAGPGSASKTPLGRGGATAWLGLGGHPGPGQINLNLTQVGVVASVGVDQLRKEREADGERRKSEHRGSWTASNFERWRSAIENYVSSVKPGNQTSLNTARVPFASYINSIHNRIHPIFADTFLGSLDSLPREHPLNDPKLVTKLEIVVSRDGHILKMGIVKPSGLTAFDVAALDSVQRASPFGPAPTAIVSPDGNVYLHWEFHRDEIYACSTMFAFPFMLNVPPKGPPVDPTPNPTIPPSPTREQGAPPPVNVHETREGALPMARGSVAST